MKIKHSKEWYYYAEWIAKVAGYVFCILPTIIVGLILLPHIVVQKAAESTLSGTFIVVLLAAAFPLYKGLMKILKSPSAAVIMWILFAFMALCRAMQPQTINALYWVFLTAAIGNTLGALAFWLEKEFEKLWAGCGQVAVMSMPATEKQ